MTPRKEGSSPAPAPEKLTAYVDGELKGSDCLKAQAEAIEAWLAAHPEAGADIAAWQRLQRLCQETRSPAPTEDTWEPVLAGIQEGLQDPDPIPVRRGRLPWGWLAGGAAAAVLLAVLLGRVAGPLLYSPVAVPPVAAQKPAPPEIEVLPVAEHKDVEILRVDGEDAETLVVGECPVEGELVLAEQGDVKITRVTPMDNQPKPDMNGMSVGDSTRPMIWGRTGAEEDGR
jgi:hypothetical protein